METDIDVMLRTCVEPFTLKRRITYGEATVFLGSCFADTIGSRFAEYALPAISNPLGVLYNPASVAALVRQALAGSEAELPLYETEGQWRCWLAGTQIKAASAAECRRMVTEQLVLLRERLTTARHLFVTLGTNVCYQLRETGLVVCNCHKAPSTLFEEKRLSTSECAESLSEVVRLVREVNPSVEVVFTVSPYRYLKYSLHGSQLSKAALLLAVDEVERRFPETVTYLPIYELFMDELRDYRFYAADMVHPSEVAVRVVWERLKGECMTETLRHYLVEYEPLRRALAHRPLDPDSPQYQSFIAETEQKRAALIARYTNNTETS